MVANSSDISEPIWKTVNTERHYGDENIAKSISLFYKEKVVVSNILSPTCLENVDNMALRNSVISVVNC
jgi:hypothetical protein